VDNLNYIFYSLGHSGQGKSCQDLSLFELGKFYIFFRNCILESKPASVIKEQATELGISWTNYATATIHLHH